MTHITLPSTELKLSRITYGAWAIGGWLWGGNETEDSLASIASALDHGITTFDTAPVYGFGLSEELLGKALKGKRDRVQILTKYGLRWDGEPGSPHSTSTDEHGIERKIIRYARKESVMAECEASLRRLQTDYIDLYQIHWMDPLTPMEDTLEAIDRLLEQGKIRAAGLCNASAEQFEAANALLPLASNQVPYSMVERKIEAEVIPQALAEKKAILAYSPLQRGLLTGKIGPDYSFAPGDHRPTTPLFQPESLRRVNQFLDQIRPIAEEKEATLAQLVIQWTLAQPGITLALVGARNARQAKENALAAQVELSAAEVKRINQLLEEFGLG